MREFDEKSITQAVIARLSGCDDPRFKRIMTSLITHLHDFVREVKLDRARMARGHSIPHRRRQDVHGQAPGVHPPVGHAGRVGARHHPQSSRGPGQRRIDGVWVPSIGRALRICLAAAILPRASKGEPTFYSGRVLSVDGRPLENAVLDIWSGDGEGNYDMQIPGETEMKARGRIRTDAEGRYWFRSIRPTFYPVPTDGPVGRMLRKMGRHPYRPGHIHMIVSAPGHSPVTTHLFVADSQYLDSDAVFGMKESLVAQFERHPPGVGPNGERMDTPFYTVNYDFRLRPVP